MLLFLNKSILENLEKKEGKTIMFTATPNYYIDVTTIE